MDKKVEFHHMLRLTMLCQPERIEEVQDELRKLAADACGYDDMLLGRFLSKLEELYYAPLRVGEWKFNAATCKTEFRRLSDYELLYCELSEKAHDAVIEQFKHGYQKSKLGASWVSFFGRGDTMTACHCDILNELNHFHLMIGTVPVII